MTPEATEERPDEAAPPPARGWRRWARGRPGAAVAGVLAGALLGAGTVAWQTDALPFLADDPCWGALSERDLEDLPLGSEEIRTEEFEPRSAMASDGGLRGECRLTGYDRGAARWQVTVRLHTLDGLRGEDDGTWPERYLYSGMTPLGDGLNGMVSPSRAWLALPEGCLGKPDAFEAPTVVDVDAGLPDVGDPERDREMRAVLARVVTRAANAGMAELGCSGTLREPGRLAELPRPVDTPEDALCGIEGFTVPRGLRDPLALQRTTSGSGGPARSCELGHSGHDLGAVRFTTVADPGLAEVFAHAAMDAGVPIEGDGSGSFGDRLSVVRLSCQTGAVAFLLRQEEGDTNRRRIARTLLPGYVSAEAERLGCGDAEIRMPGPV